MYLVSAWQSLPAFLATPALQSLHTSLHPEENLTLFTDGKGKTLRVKIHSPLKGDRWIHISSH